MQRTTISSLSLMTATGLLLTGCTTGAGASGAQNGGGATTDTIRTTIDLPATFDPTKGLSLPDFLAARMSYDTLLRKDADSKLAPGLAASWKATATDATFVLRKGATCSDGTPITPSVVKNSFEYLTNPATAASAAPQVFGPAGEPVFTADDATNTFSITLAQPWPDMLTGLAMSPTGVICPAGLKDTKALATGDATGSESGPYTLASKEHGVRYTYELRDGYNAWPEYSQPIEGQPAKKVVYNVIADKNATANQLLSGQLDTGFINATSLNRFKDDDKFTSTNEPFSDFYVVFNQREGSPFTDPAVRKAAAQVLDRKAFENVTSSGLGQVTTQLVATGTVCSDPGQSPVIAVDAEAAKKVLNGVTIRMVGPQIMGPQGSGNVYVQEQLRAAGATVKLDNLDVGGWISTVFGKPGDWDMTVYADLNFMGTMANPLASFMGPTIQEGGGNIGGARNAAAEAAFGEFLTASDKDAQCAALQESMNSLIENADAVPLSNDPRVMVAAQGFAVTSLGGALDDQILRIKK